MDAGGGAWHLSAGDVLRFTLIDVADRGLMTGPAAVRQIVKGGQAPAGEFSKLNFDDADREAARFLQIGLAIAQPLRTVACWFRSPSGKWTLACRHGWKKVSSFCCCE